MTDKQKIEKIKSFITDNLEEFNEVLSSNNFLKMKNLLDIKDNLQEHIDDNLVVAIKDKNNWKLSEGFENYSIDDISLSLIHSQKLALLDEYDNIICFTEDYDITA